MELVLFDVCPGCPIPAIDCLQYATAVVTPVMYSDVPMTSGRQMEEWHIAVFCHTFG